tara:strand:+ start:2234 stop:3757 length:1524 start_codon:yes stop_codon:yes gene_type:complete
MKARFFVYIFLLPITVFSQLNPQSKKLTNKFFPDPNIEINTPAFNKKKGFTKYDEMMSFLKEHIANHEDEVKLEFVGESQKGKKIPILYFDRVSNNNKVKVFFQAGLHGNEPASTEGILYLIDQILNNKEYNKLLDRITLAVIPMANIDGYEKNDRYASNGLDLNRDHTKLLAKESICLKQAFSDFEAEVSVDFHEYTPFRKDFAKLGTFGISNIYDVMFLYTGNLNVPRNLREYTNYRFVENARDVLSKNNLRHHDYLSSHKFQGSIHFKQGSNSARSSCTAFALTNSISSLIEVRGVGIGKRSFKRRVNSTFLVALSYLQTSYDNVEEVKQIISQAKKDRSFAVLKSKLNIYKKNIQVLDLDKSEEVTFEAIIHDKLNATAIDIRERPKAYLIKSDQYDVIEKLKLLGLKLESINEKVNYSVEQYVIEEYFKEKMKYEGVYMQKVKSKTEKINLAIDNNWIILNMDQRNSNLAIEVLEPEAPNSFVSYSVIPTFQGDVLPIYRLN